jgi:hypothetical protein
VNVEEAFANKFVFKIWGLKTGHSNRKFVYLVPRRFLVFSHSEMASGMPINWPEPEPELEQGCSSGAGCSSY